MTQISELRITTGLFALSEVASCIIVSLINLCKSYLLHPFTLSIHGIVLYMNRYLMHHVFPKFVKKRKKKYNYLVSN
jgi:hypothetical protein